MPSYDIRNKKTGEVQEVFCSYEKKEETLKEYGPDWEYMVAAPVINYSGIPMSQRLDDGFKDVLKKAKDAGGKSRSWRKNSVNDYR